MIINSGNLQTLYRGYNAAFREGFGQAPEQTTRRWSYEASRRRRAPRSTVGWARFPGLRRNGSASECRPRHSGSTATRSATGNSSRRSKSSRDDIEDDHYGVYSPRCSPRWAGPRPRILAKWFSPQLKSGFATPCYDGQYFFDTDHPGR